MGSHNRPKRPLHSREVCCSHSAHRSGAHLEASIESLCRASVSEGVVICEKYAAPMSHQWQLMWREMDPAFLGDLLKSIRVARLTVVCPALSAELSAEERTSR